MRIVDLLKKAFIGGEWYVGYREREKKEYSIVSLEKGWIADPFLFEYQGEHYLFVEYVNGKKGEIAYFKYVENTFVFQSVIISEPYHLSYPCIFAHGNNVYMIPESADNRTIDLYKSIDFPEKWEKIATLAHGIYFDTTYINYEEKDYLISYSPKKGRFSLSLFSFDVEKLEADKVLENEYMENVGRPAGMMFGENGKMIRPAQDCSRKYGENILFYEIDKLGREGYVEKVRSSITAQDTDERFQRVHTYNRDSQYEVVDFFLEKVHLLRPIKLIYKILKRNCRK